MEKTKHVQDEDNSPSIEHILRPISYISWFLGVGVAHPRRCSKVVTIIIRVVHLALCSISLAYEICDSFRYYEILSSFFGVVTNVLSFTYYIDFVISYVSTYYYICYGISQYDKWLELMDKLENLDQKIKKDTSMNDQPVKYLEATAILATFACFPLYPITYNVYDYCTYSQLSFLNWNLLYYYMLAQVLINSFVFDIVVYVLYYRFQTINKLIGQLDELSDAQCIALQIRHIRELHNGICDLINMVNDIHGVQLFLWLMNCITTVLTTLFIAYTYFMHESYFNMINAYIVCIVFVIQFVVKCWICTLTRQESERSGIFVYGFLLSCKNLNGDYVRNEINDFAIQLQLHQVAFTDGNFFEINNSLFISFAGVIVSNLILIQFYK